MENLFYEFSQDCSANLLVNMRRDGNAEPHFHRCIEILYLLEGKMQCRVGSSEFVAEADDIVFVHNYYVHAFKPIGGYKKIYFIIPFNYGNDLDPIFGSFTLPQLLSDKAFNATLRHIFEQMLDEKNTMPELVKKGYLNVVIGSLIDHYPTAPIEKSDRSINLLANILNYINDNYKLPLSLSSLAETFGYNKYYFSRLFNKHVGENLNTYINIVRLQHFMNEKPEKSSVTDLAYACGFDSLTTFYRYYNKLYAEKPKAFLSSTEKH